MPEIDLYNFLSIKTIIHNQTATDFNAGLMFLFEKIQQNQDPNNPHTHIITYNSVNHVSINNFTMLDVVDVDDSKKYCYHFYLDKYIDLIDNIILEPPILNTTAQITYYIDNKKLLYNQLNTFVLCAGMHSEFVIRVTFLEKPNLNDEFQLKMRNYLIEPEERKLLSTHSLGVLCDNIRYYNGMCCL
jgi:hypothetical protein